MIDYRRVPKFLMFDPTNEKREYIRICHECTNKEKKDSFYCIISVLVAKKENRIL